MENKKSNLKKEILVKSLVMALALTVCCTFTAFADGGDYVANIKNYVLQAISAILACFLAWHALTYLAKKQFAAFAGFIILAACVAVVVVSPDILTQLGKFIATKAGLV